MPGPAVLVPAAISAASSLAGAIGGGKGGRQPSSTVSPEALAALRAGTAGANESLAGLPVPSGQSVIDTYAAIANRLAGMEAPNATIDPEAMTADIARTTAAANAPARAATARQFQEASGAFGPSAALNQARAGQTAEESNLMAKLIASIRPQLAQQQFDQNLQRLTAALGIEQAKGAASTTPVDLLQRLRQGSTGQLLGAGAEATRPTTYESTVPSWTAPLTSAAGTLAQLGTSINTPESKKPAPSSGGWWTDWKKNENDIFGLMPKNS